MESKPGCSDVLIALRMLADVVSECLGSMTGERLDGVADDGQLTCGDGDVGTYPGLELPVRRIELRPGRSGLLEGFGLIRGWQTRGTRELFGGLGQGECLSAGDVIAGPIVPTGGQDGGGYIRQVIARDPGDGAVAGRSTDDAFRGEPTWSPIKVEARAQERIPSAGCTDPLLGEVVLASMCEGRPWGSSQKGGVDDALDARSESGIDGAVALLQTGWPVARNQEQCLDAAEGSPHRWPIFIGGLDDLSARKLWGSLEVSDEQALRLAEGGESGCHSASKLSCGASHPNQRDRSSHAIVLSCKQFPCEE